MNEKTTVTIPAKHVFTQDEKNALTDKLLAAMRAETQEEAELASLKANSKSRMERITLDRDDAARKLGDGWEMRETLALVAMNHPSPGRKTFFHAISEEDGFTAGEAIRTDDMDWSEKNPPLPLEEKKPEKIDEPRPQSKDVLPLGCVLVTEGDTQEGDWVWVEAHGIWEAVAYEPGISAASYVALARPIASKPVKVGFSDDTEGMTPIAKALNAVAVGTELKPVPFKIDPLDDVKAIAKKFAKAAGAFGWPQVCIALLRDEIKKAKTEADARVTLAPHIDETSAETQTGSE